MPVRVQVAFFRMKSEGSPGENMGDEHTMQSTEISINMSAVNFMFDFPTMRLAL